MLCENSQCWGCWILVFDCFFPTGCTGFITGTRGCPRCVFATIGGFADTSRRAVWFLWSWWILIECSYDKSRFVGDNKGSFWPVSCCIRSRVFLIRVGSRTKHLRWDMCWFWLIIRRWDLCTVSILLSFIRQVIGWRWDCFSISIHTHFQDHPRSPVCLRSCAAWFLQGRTHPSSLVYHFLV